jgi:drug/metabolite transporter (DMT)-like permease
VTTPPRGGRPLRTALLAGAALVAFAANSVLARLALRGGGIDAASYSTIRLASGAVVLSLLVWRRGTARPLAAGSWIGALFLFLYAAPFSYAYLSLATGTGALILFAAVQVTMILMGIRGGERPQPREWLGLVLALAGLVWLVLPGIGAPAPLGAALMAVAGISWGFYSLRGRRSGAPLADTTGNFLRATPLALGLTALTLASATMTPTGVLYAILSGGLASGVGYAIWYAALPGLTATRAATIQLAVPVVAAVAGVILLAEPPSVRLVSAAAAILGGVGLAVSARARRV